MLETTNRLEQKEDPRFNLAPAFSGRLATKTRENDALKALLLGEHKRAPASISRCLHSTHRAIIVVVDDEPHIAIAISEIWERRGYRPVWFTEPVAPLELLQAHRPDVLLTDVNMPMLNGFDLALCLKRTHPNCRVLVTSALGNDPEFAERITTAGVSVVLEAKPVQICRFLCRTAKLILAGTYAASAESFDSRGPR